jgi:hypothetical protein
MKTIIRETEFLRLTLCKKECLTPQGLFHITMLQERLDDGKVTDSSTYQFFLENDNLATLSESLIK